MQKDTGIAQDQHHLPPGYPAAVEVPELRGQQDKNKKKKLETKQRGDKGFIEGCLFALCCCWIWKKRTLLQCVKLPCVSISGF
nr:unnamed protein product [Brassica oleracea]